MTHSNSVTTRCWRLYRASMLAILVLFVSAAISPAVFATQHADELRPVRTMHLVHQREGWVFAVGGVRSHYTPEQLIIAMDTGHAIAALSLAFVDRDPVLIDPAMRLLMVCREAPEQARFGCLEAARYLASYDHADGLDFLRSLACHDVEAPIGDWGVLVRLRAAAFLAEVGEEPCLHFLEKALDMGGHIFVRHALRSFDDMSDSRVEGLWLGVIEHARAEAAGLAHERGDMAARVDLSGLSDAIRTQPVVTPRVLAAFEALAADPPALEDELERQGLLRVLDHAVEHLRTCEIREPRTVHNEDAAPPPDSLPTAD